jgi:hypothetical protein
MNAIDNRQFAGSDISLGALLEAAAANPDKALVFHYEGRAVKSGYHVTEVKAGQFAALDCGANPEAWSEIFVQLWDVDEAGRGHMPAGKFAAIVGKVSEHVKLDGSAKLTFEVSDGVAPMQLYFAAAPVIDGTTLRVDLKARPSSCKPRDRWLASLAETVPSACCGPAAGPKASGCCG